MRFNPPPNWPEPPHGWSPPAGWEPDPAWGPPPEGWQLWVADADRTTRPRRRKHTGRKVLIGTGALVALVIAIGAANGSQPAEDDVAAEPATGTSTAEAADKGAASIDPPVAEAAEPEVEEGTRENPFHIGTDVTDGEWDVVLGEPFNGTQAVLAENMFNDEPPAGQEFWIVPVHAVYNGTESGTPWIDLTINFVGDDARTYSDACGVIPNNLSDIDELYPGGVADGNVCVSVPAGAPGLWTLETGWFSETAFFDANAD